MQDTYKKIHKFVESMAKKKLRSTDRLYTTKLINSMGIIDLVVAIENEFAIKINANDITEENFDSIAQISHYVSKAMHLRKQSNDYY